MTTNSLSTPMDRRPYPTPPAGSPAPGDKDGMEALKGAAAGNLASPMHGDSPWTKVGQSTGGAPVKFQVTEDVQKMVGGGNFPTGTGSRVGGG
jgi:hypothetical protein